MKEHVYDISRYCESTALTLYHAPKKTNKRIF